MQNRYFHAANSESRPIRSKATAPVTKTLIMYTIISDIVVCYQTYKIDMYYTQIEVEGKYLAHSSL